MTKGLASNAFMAAVLLAGLNLSSPAWAQLGQRLKQLIANHDQPAAGPPYSFYEGDLHFEKGRDPVCTALTNGVYKVYFAAHVTPTGGVEAYMFGEQIMHAYISGSDRSHLGVTYLGDSAPSRTLKLTPFGSNGFIGLVQSKTLVSELYGACTQSGAEFKVTRTDRDGESAFQSYAQQFKLDVNSEQDLGLARRGAVREAMPRLQQAFADKRKQFTELHPQMLRYYFYMASAFDEAGMYPYSAFWYQKSADVCNLSFGPENACAPITLLKLGVSQFYIGNTRDAEANIRHALAVSDKVFGPDAPVSWIGFDALAGVLIGTGRYAEAESTLDHALTLAKKPPVNDLNAATVKVMYAALYRQTGKYKLAEATLREAITSYQKSQGYSSAQSVGPRIELAQMLRLTGQLSSAELIGRDALEAALQLLGPERPDHPALSTARIGLGNIYVDEGKLREAEPLYRQALENDKKYLGADHPSVALDEVSLAKLLRMSGQPKEVLPLLLDAYRISHLTTLQGIRWRVPAEIMEFYATVKPGNPLLAVFYGKEAVNALQSLRGNLSPSGGDSQQSFVGAAEVKAVYKRLAHLLLKIGRIGEAQQVLALLSEQEMDQFSQRSLLAGAASNAPASSSPASSSAAPEASHAPGVTRGAEAPHGSTSAPPLAATAPAAASPAVELAFDKSEKEAAALLAAQIKDGYELDRLQKLQDEQGTDFSSTDLATLTQLQHRYEDQQKKLKAATEKIAKSSGNAEARNLRETAISGFSDSFRGTLKNMQHDAALAQYFVSDDAVSIILTLPLGSPVSAESPIPQAQLNTLIRDFRATLSDTGRNPLPDAQRLYQILIEPIAGALATAHTKTLMLVLHDALRYVPFAALNDGKSYLIENMAVAIVNDAARDKLGTPPNPTPWSVWGMGVTKGGKDYSDLPNAGRELTNIRDELGGQSQVNLDKDFTEASMHRGTHGNYPVIHIASHFQFAPGSIDDSVLLLGDGSLLSLKQIENRFDFTGVELLTLSACETALGDDRLAPDGSEVEGLGVVAQKKGAMAVIATLWPVADESTATLMNALYKAHKDGHLDKAEALQSAQLSLLRGTAPPLSAAGGDERRRGLTRPGGAAAATPPVAEPPAAAAPSHVGPASFSHPYYWAPFILMGNWL